MDDNPLITIAIPFYNPGKFLIEAVKSVISQTYINWELIVINDGSTDGSSKFIYNIKDPRVRIIEDGKRLGLPKRLNMVAKLARGSYIARMDADDMMHPERLKKQLRYLKNNPEVDVVDTGAFIIDDNNKIVGTMGLNRNEIPELIESFKRGVVLHPSIMGKRSWFVDNAYSNEYPRAEDRELFIRKYCKMKIGHIPKPLHFYRYTRGIELRKILLGYSSERKVLIKYGPEHIGKRPTLTLYTRSLLKSAAIIPIVAFKKDHIITKLRYEEISNNLLMEGYAAIRTIENIVLPEL